MNIIPIDNQPMQAGFFGQGKRLTEFITPDNLDIQALHSQLVNGIQDPLQRLEACWSWVANQVKYVRFVHGSLNIHGKVSIQKDLWCEPSIVMHTRIGNCFNKSSLLASMLRNELDAGNVYCVLGNLLSPKDAGGHAWVQVQLGGKNYIMEATRNDVPLVPLDAAMIYEPVHYFNDKETWAVEGRTVMTPYANAYSSWLKDYLNWGYINAGANSV